jgi:hypothetical protein
MTRRSLPFFGLTMTVLCLVTGAALLSQPPFRTVAAQTAAQQGPARAIAAPSVPLPPEAASAGVTKFSFIAYGDTRGRHDGTELQAEHGMVIDGMLDAIKRLSATPYPVKFVLQSGDAVVSGRDAAQWNVSFIPLINRLTTEGGVPYFLVPGNHDLGTSTDLANPLRQAGLVNYYAALANLIPPAGSPRRLDGYPAFAFGYGNTFVLGIDSNIAGDPTQFAWAKKQLEGLDRARYVNVVAFFHHPPFSSGPHGGAVVEPQAQTIRDLYLPLFQTHRVRLVLSGHDHLFEHWVERYVDASGQPQRMDMVVSAGGGAPLYTYQGEPNTSDYVRKNAAAKVRLEHLVKPGPAMADNPYHFVIFQVDGDSISLDVVAVDWGAGFKPYRSSGTSLNGR